MNINPELKEIKKIIGKKDIEKNLIQNIIKFLGGEESPFRNRIDLTNKHEVAMIKNDLLLTTLALDKNEANTIIKNVLKLLEPFESLKRTVFYYFIIQEMNSPKKRLPNVHPGEVLQEEFLKPMEISAYKLSKDIGVPQTRISMILKEKRGITADTALRLSKYFGTSSKFWLGLQNDYDLEESKKKNILDLTRIKKCA